MSPEGKNIELLLVDDSADILYIMKRLLKSKYDFNVTTSLSAEDAMKLMREHKFDAIVSDLHMPGMGGKLLYAQMLKEEISIPLIFFSGSDEIRDEALSDVLHINKNGEMSKHIKEIADWVMAQSLNSR